jgi:hypothetical protein
MQNYEHGLISTIPLPDFCYPHTKTLMPESGSLDFQFKPIIHYIVVSVTQINEFMINMILKFPTQIEFYTLAEV